MTNWRAMQVPVTLVKREGSAHNARGGVQTWVNPGVLPRYLAAGSFTPRNLRRK